MEYAMECPNELCKRQMKEIWHDDDKVEFVCLNPKCQSLRVTSLFGLREREQNRIWNMREKK